MNKEKKSKKKIICRILLIILIVILSLIAIAVSAFFILRSVGKKQLTEETVQMEAAYVEHLDVDIKDDGKTVIYNGKSYIYNSKLVNILFMGVDKAISETDSENIGGNGQADALILAVINTETGAITLLNIPRDSMVDVNQYNVDGKYIGVNNMQVCLAYAHGDGKETSCENTKSAVSRLLYGMPINAYVALDLDGISVLNDTIGGVTVEILEDVHYSGGCLYKGDTVTLNGKQAYGYVRGRDMSKLDSSLLRIARQKQYMGAFLSKALAATREDINAPLALYDAAKPYMVTDIGVSSVTYLASIIVEHGVSGGTSITIPGEIVKGEKYAEYITDDMALYELILDVFYKGE